MSWVPLAIGGWLLVSMVVALVIGLAIRLADRMARGPTGGGRDLTGPPRGRSTAGAPRPTPPAPRRPRRLVPLPSGSRSGRLPPAWDRSPASGLQPTTPAADPRSRPLSPSGG